MHGFRGVPNRVTFLTALAASIALPSIARADFYLHYWKNEHEAPRDFRFDAQVGYYDTKSNFDGGGVRLIPVGFQEYSRIQSDLMASYGISSRLSAYVRLGWARSVLNQTTAASTTFGLTDNSLGLSYRLFDFSNPSKPNGITIDLQLQCDIPFYSNDLTTGPPLGDATFDTTVGAFINVPLFQIKSSSVSASLGGGFTYRTSDFSRALPWSAFVQIIPRNDGFTFSLGAYGTQSLNSDPRAASLSTSSTALSSASGGSFISNAVNPSLMTMRGEAGYQIGSDVGIAAFFGQTLWGQAAPSGYFVGGSIKTHIGNPARGDSAHLSAQDYGRSNRGFVNYGIEARVTRVNDRLNLVKLDKGNQDGVATDQTFDVFRVKKDGNVGEAVARGHISSVLPNESALTIDEYYKEVWIDEGFLAKRPVQ